MFEPEVDDLVIEMEMVLEAATVGKLTSAERNNLPDSSFGLPSQRKYPLIIPNDQKSTHRHILQAMRFFHYCPGPNRKELAINIKKAIDEHKLNIIIKETSLINKYL